MAARSSGLAPTSRTRGGQGTSVCESVRARPAGQRGERPEQRRRDRAGRRTGRCRRGTARRGRAGPAARPSRARSVGRPRPRTPARGARPTTCKPLAPQVEQPPARRGRDGSRADDDGRRVAQQLGAEPLTEPAGDRCWKARGISHGARSSRVADDRQPRRDRQRARPRPRGRRLRRHRPARRARPPRATRRAGGTGPRSSPAAQQEPGRGQQPAADDLEVPVPRRRVVEVGARGRRRTTRPRSGSASKAPQQALEVGGGQRGPVGRLERADVEDDADARDRSAPRRRSRAPIRRPLGHDAATAKRAGRAAPRPGAGRPRRAPRRRSGGSSSTGRCAGPGR